MSQTESQIYAYVLHSRPFQEASAIIQVFSLELGRMSLIAKGLKGKNSQSRKALLQPFQPLQISYLGKSDLKTLTHCDKSIARDLSGATATEVELQIEPMSIITNADKLACGYYANEILIRALPEFHEFSAIYQAYQRLLSGLSLTEVCLPLLLRSFEVAVLSELGIAPDWHFDIQHEPIDQDKTYHFIPQSGFVVCEPKTGYSSQKQTNSSNQREFSGQTILGLANGKIREADLKSAQQLSQFLLREIIGERPLQSRKMWQHSRNNQN
ncbi:MAG: DNA repair protein RecO [Kangiellaceae bacterium]|nr:DNA repair protein RecO [Kangiellaceae bacterium]MCW8998897.1 DNA repair protein RecO [Kangiellaceae bacterium]